jgi:hypothetical protein
MMSDTSNRLDAVLIRVCAESQLNAAVLGLFANLDQETADITSGKTMRDCHAIAESNDITGRNDVHRQIKQGLVIGQAKIRTDVRISISLVPDRITSQPRGF